MGENAKGSAATVSGTPRSLISLKSIKKPCESRTMQKETGHQSRYALYQNWCPVMVQVTGLEPTRLMRHWHLKLALSVCGTSSASTKSKISCCGTSSASTKSKISCCGTSSATTKSKIWCNSATAVLKCISNKKTSRISTTCFGAGDGT